MDEQLVEGDYTALVDLRIRATMHTIGNEPVGVYSRGVPFVVYEVYPEKDGIVWGRVSSNTGQGSGRYVGLRVNSQHKAHLEKAFKIEGGDIHTALLNSLIGAINALTLAVSRLADKVN